MKYLFFTLCCLYIFGCGQEYPPGYLGGRNGEGTHELPPSPPVIVVSPTPSPTNSCYQDCRETEHHYICGKHKDKK